MVDLVPRHRHDERGEPHRRTRRPRDRRRRRHSLALRYLAAVAVPAELRVLHTRCYDVRDPPSTSRCSPPRSRDVRVPVVEHGSPPDLHGRHRILSLAAASPRSRSSPGPPAALAGLFLIVTLSVIGQVGSSTSSPADACSGWPRCTTTSDVSWADPDRRALLDHPGPVRRARPRSVLRRVGSGGPMTRPDVTA